MLKPLLVMKFGGTSVGSPAAIRRSAELAARAAAEFRVIVVASAMSKVTDLLLDTLEQGERGAEAAVEANLQTLLDQHLAAAAELAPEERRPAVEARLRELLDRYARIARGMLLLRERPPGPSMKPSPPARSSPPCCWPKPSPPPAYRPRPWTAPS